MNEIKVVLGSMFGDEGKGVTVQWLCEEAKHRGKSVCVVRYSGGPQAAHTVRYGEKEHICSTFGSGVLLGVDTFYLPSAYLDIICAYNEYKVLKKKGIDKPKLYVSSHTPTILPYDVLHSRKDEKTLSDGTCGKGVFAARVRNERGSDLIRTNANSYKNEVYAHDYDLKWVSGYYGIERDEELEKLYHEAVDHSSEFLRIVDADEVASEIKKYDVVIFEGTQGLLLDGKYGFYPHVTATEVGLEPVIKYLENEELIKAYLKPEVFLVTRTYLTRHGNGYEPFKCAYNLDEKYESNVYNDYQGEFKVGVLEEKLFEKMVDRHHLDNIQIKYNLPFNLVITHMDVAMRNGYFSYMIDGAERRTEVLNGEDIRKVVFVIQNMIKLPFTNYYYNDSPSSFVKEIKIS